MDKQQQVWNSERYDLKLGFVSEYGKDVLQLLQPASGERILDLGCGTGDLTYLIQQSGAHVTGLDLSAEMIEQAKAKYPALNLIVGNGEHFQLGEQFDAVFSNAALHWMKQPIPVIDTVWRHLKSQGRFVAEFGGKGNVERVVQAIREVLQELYGWNADELNPWYFPSIGQYSSLLEERGFRVVYAAHFDRPTRMEDEERGLRLWLDSFAQPFLSGLSRQEADNACERIAQKVKPDLFYDGAWHIDYKRLRIVAIKHD